MRPVKGKYETFLHHDHSILILLDVLNAEESLKGAGGALVQELGSGDWKFKKKKEEKPSCVLEGLGSHLAISAIS